MADPENQGTTAQSDPAPAEKSGSGGSGGDIGLSMVYIMSIPGILKIVEFFTLMIAFSLGADLPGTWGRMKFFLFVAITSWIIVIAVFVLFALNIISRINLNIDWNIPVFIFAIVVAVLLLISSSLIADNAEDWKAFSGFSSLDKLRAAAAFGFISMFVFIGDAVVHFLKYNGQM